MLRAILGVIGGYLVMFVIVFVTFTLAYLAMGTERAFQPGTYEVTALWLVVSFALGFLGAVAGGYVCAALSRSFTVACILAGILLALGLFMAIPVALDQGQPPARTGDVGNFEAMQNAKQPLWVALLNPLFGAIGVVVGATLKARRDLAAS